MKPRKGAKPVPGPIIITGVVGLNGRRNCVLRTNMGTLGELSSREKKRSLTLSQFVREKCDAAYTGRQNSRINSRNMMLMSCVK